MHQLIIDAVNGKHVLRFSYDGKDRIVEPHCYGLDNENHDALRAFQLGAGWRLFHTSKILSLHHDGTKFRDARAGYNPADKAMKTIYARL